MATTAITIRSSGVGGGSSPQQEHEDPLILRIAASLGHAAVITRGDGKKRNEISDSEGSAVMRLGRVLLGVAVLLNVAVPQVASSQMKSPPGGTTPAGALFSPLPEPTTRPRPPAPSPTVPAPAEAWAPDRYVQGPGADGPVLVPRHLERMLYVPH